MEEDDIPFRIFWKVANVGDFVARLNRNMKYWVGKESQNLFVAFFGVSGLRGREDHEVALTASAAVKASEAISHITVYNKVLPL